MLSLISLLSDTTSTIPATRRLVFSFWVVHLTTYQVRKHFVGKDFESITEMDNLDTVAKENAVAETNDFFRHLRCCWRRHLTFSTQSSRNSWRQLFHFSKNFYFLYRIWGNCRATFLTLISNLIANKIYSRNL